MADYMIIVKALRVAVFVGFFSFAGAVIWFGREREELKKLFTVALVIGITVPLVVGPFPPFAQWLFFTDPAPQNATQYTVYVVDDRGVEYDYPAQAAPPGRVDHRGEQIATASGEDARTQQEVAAFLLQRAQHHRASLRDGLSIRETVRYRSIDSGFLGRDTWTPAEARRMGTIERLRIYRTTINTSADGLTIENESRTLVYTYPDQ